MAFLLVRVLCLVQASLPWLYTNLMLKLGQAKFCLQREPNNFFSLARYESMISWTAFFLVLFEESVPPTPIPIISYFCASGSRKSRELMSGFPCEIR